MLLFIPAKVTDNEWAEKLLDGEIFMRPLHEFGSWGRVGNHMNKELNNDFRGDISEGTSSVFKNADDSEIFSAVDPELKSVANNLRYIDDEMQFIKIFSLYCLEYVPEIDGFKKPDSRMKEFGNTAVIIQNFSEFTRRFLLAIFKKWPDPLVLMDRVRFYDFSESRKVDPLFNKMTSYSYQNELRLAASELVSGNIVRSLQRETIQIGDIRDIAIKLDIDDFLNLNLPTSFWWKWAVSYGFREKTVVEHLIEETRQQMRNHYPRQIKVMFSL